MDIHFILPAYVFLTLRVTTHWLVFIIYKSPIFWDASRVVKMQRFLFLLNYITQAFTEMFYIIVYFVMKSITWMFTLLDHLNVCM